MPKIKLEFEIDLDSCHYNQGGVREDQLEGEDLKLILLDSIAQFVKSRELAEDYVISRYTTLCQDEGWFDRKVADVRRRVKLAKLIYDNVCTLKLKKSG